jgi:hypothetical protein
VLFGGAGLLPVLGFAPGAFTALTIIQAILVGITAFTVLLVLHSIAPRRAKRLRAPGRHRIPAPPRGAAANPGQVEERQPAVVARTAL